MSKDAGKALAKQFFQMRPNGIEFAIEDERFEEVTILVSNCDDVAKGKKKLVAFLNYLIEESKQQS